MRILGIQILAVFFAFFMLYGNFINYKKGKLPSSSYFLWTTLWIGFITFAIFPQFLDPIIKPLNITRALDLLMIVAFAILTILSFTNYLKNLEIEKKIEKLVRDEAINNKNNENK